MTTEQLVVYWIEYILSDKNLLEIISEKMDNTCRAHHRWAGKAVWVFVSGGLYPDSENPL